MSVSTGIVGVKHSQTRVYDGPLKGVTGPKSVVKATPPTPRMGRGRINIWDPTFSHFMVY